VKIAYEQQYVRTMFFAKTDKISIDGTLYEITNPCQVDCWNCKGNLYEQYTFLVDRYDERDAETYTSWKKEYVKLLKEWDKLYVKHVKNTYPDMNKIHMQAMQPLNSLIESNVNFHKLELMIKNKEEVPQFRFKALEYEFCKFFTGICEILKEFGNLKNHYNIAQMLKTMKIEDWRIIRPFEFYLTPLDNAIKTVRTSLLEMNRLGHLRRRYIIEYNYELADQIEAMVKQDNIVQMLVGDELKQDQFNFIYQTLKIIFDSALCDKFVNMKTDKSSKVIEDSVIPELVAYKGVMRIRDIQLRKYNEEKKAKEKAERDGASTEEVKEKDPMKMTEEEIYAKKLENEANGGPNMSDAEKQRREEEKERKEYGRFWVWEGYFNEKIKQKWLDTAEMLKHINNHVLQDIEDYIILKGFGKQIKGEKLRDLIENDHAMRMDRAKRQLEEGQEEFEERANKHTIKRKFMNQLRPPHYWNFFEDGPEELKVKHVLRYNADPCSAYSDGRVEAIIQNIMEIGNNLKGYEDVKWNQL